MSRLGSFPNHESLEPQSKMKKCLFRMVTVLCLCSGIALAQRYEISPLVSYPRFSRKALGSLNETNNRDTDTQIRGRMGYGLRLTANTKGYYGHEIGYILSKADFRTDIATTSADGRTVTRTRKIDEIQVQQAFYNFMIYMMPAGERVRPYITGGAHMTRYGAPAIEEFDRRAERKYGVNFGAGLKFKLMEHVNVRLDLRDYINGAPFDLKFEDQTKFSAGLFQQLEGSVGISITF
jgi:hypothetical protein